MSVGMHGPPKRGQKGPNPKNAPHGSGLNVPRGSVDERYNHTIPTKYKK